MKDFFNKVKNRKKNDPLDEVKKMLSKKNACYVLLTCSKPTKEGKMLVEVCYEGDECIASYLIDNAQEVLAEKFNQSEDSC